MDIGGSVIIRRVSEHTVVLEVSGEVDAADTAALSRAIVGAVRHGHPHQVLMTMAGAVRVDSQGIGAIVAGSAVAADHGIMLVVEGARTVLAEALRAAGLPPQCLAAVGGHPWGR